PQTNKAVPMRNEKPDPASPSNLSSLEREAAPPPLVPEYELIRRIGHGAYGEVWLARNVLGTFRAVKIVHRKTFADERPFEREFEGIKGFEPVSRLHESQVDILQVGRNEAEGYFY